MYFLILSFSSLTWSVFDVIWLFLRIIGGGWGSSWTFSRTASCLCHLCSHSLCLGEYLSMLCRWCLLRFLGYGTHVDWVFACLEHFTIEVRVVHSWVFLSVWFWFDWWFFCATRFRSWRHSYDGVAVWFCAKWRPNEIVLSLIEVINENKFVIR